MKTIYMLTDTSNGSIYIGSTSNLRRRINEHRKHRGGVCLKYGIKDFVVDVIETVETKLDGHNSELKWCKHYTEMGIVIIGQKFGSTFTKKLRDTFSKLKKEEFCSGKSKKRVISMNDDRKIKVIDQHGTVYASFSECARKIRSYPSAVMDVVNGKTKHTKGYILKRMS